VKILDINVLGIPSGSSYNLVDANVFQDYDAVVVNPEDLDDLYGYITDLYADRDERELTRKAGFLLDSVNQKRREQAFGLLQKGGIVVCFMQPLRKCSCNWHYEGEDHWVYITNYDWLLKSSDIKTELGEIKYATGTTIDYIDSGHPFSEYLNTKPSWSAYVDKDACDDWKVLASAFGTHAVSLTKRIGLGHIVAGCQVEPQPDKDSNGAVVCDYGTALLEVVGSNGTIKIEKLGQLIKNIGNYISEKRGQVKGILVGNPFCDDHLDNRPPKDSQKQLFARELLKSAEQQSITVLLSTDLYEVVSRILKGEFTDSEKQSLRECIFNGKGLVRLVQQ